VKRSIAVVALGFALLGACSSSDEAEAPASTTTTEAALPSITGTLTVGRPADFRIVPGDLPRTVHNGEYCFGLGEVDEGTKIVATNSTGEIIGIGSLEEGGITDLDSEGREITLLNFDTAFGFKRGVDCTFPFTVDLSAESPFYSVGMEDRGELTYSHEELESAGWIISITSRP